MKTGAVRRKEAARKEKRIKRKAGKGRKGKR
jgi:hypothetical protein